MERGGIIIILQEKSVHKRKSQKQLHYATKVLKKNIYVRVYVCVNAEEKKSWKT